MMQSLIVRLTRLDPELVDQAWTVLITNGLLVTTVITVKKCISPILAFCRWLKKPPPPPSALCGAVLVALEDTATTQGDDRVIRNPLRGLLLWTDTDNGALYGLKVSRDGKEFDRLSQLNQYDRRRIEWAVGEFRSRWDATQMEKDATRLLTYKSPVVVEVPPPGVHRVHASGVPLCSEEEAKAQVLKNHEKAKTEWERVNGRGA